MQRLWRWFFHLFPWLSGDRLSSRPRSSRSPADGDVRRAIVAVLLTWCGLGLGAFDVCWSALTHQWGGLMQGTAILVFGWAFLLWNT